MAISDQDIFNYFASPDKKSDEQIAKDMDTYKVTAADIARATGVDVGGVQARYDAVKTPSGGLSNVTGGKNSVLEDTSDTYVPAASSTSTASTGALTQATSTDANTRANALSAVTSAWNSGDYAATNKIIEDSGLSAKDIQNYYKLDDNTMNWVLSQGIKTADKPTGALTQATGSTVVDSTATDLPASTALTAAQKLELDNSGSTTAAPKTVTTELQGKTYTLNASDVERVKAQILAQGTTSQWTGEGFGSAEANAEAMAKNLVASGVTDINQVGQKDITVQGYTTQTEAGEEVVPDSTQTVLVNKLTGEQLISDYDRSGGSAWSGTFAGEGNTAFRTSFTPDGKPIFYTTGASSNDIVTLIGDDPILGKVATAAAAYFGGPVGVATLQAAMGKSIEDIAKGALLTYAGGQVAGSISGSTDLVSIIGSDATNILAKGAGQLVSSGGKAEIGNLLLSGGIDAGVNAITNTIEGFSDLSAGQQDFIKTVAKTTIQNGGDLSFGALIDASITAATSAAKAATSGTISQAIAADKAINDAVTAEIDKALTFDASGATDVNAALKAADEAGYGKFTFGGKTYTIDSNENAKIANLESSVKADQDATLLATTANLKGGEFDGVDAAVAANAAKDNVKIGNAEADTLEEAAALAKARNPTATTFTYGDKTYTLGTSDAQVQSALNEAKIAETQGNIDSAKTFNEAYKAARDGLGAGKIFTWNGKQYTTDTREENPSLAAASDIARLNNIAASTEAGGGRGSAASYATYDAKAAANALDKTKVIPDYTAGDAYGFNDTVYDPSTGVALLNSTATADPNTALGKAVIAANNALGSVVQTGLSNLANAGGEQTAAFGGFLAAIGATDANNMLVQAGKAAQQVGSAIETAESKQGTANIVNAVSKAEGMGGKLIAGLKAGWENPVAALNLITREGLQEILPAGVALKASKIMSLAAAAGIDTALNAGESMGQAYNDAYSAAMAKGMTKEAADALATKVGLSAGAITLVTSGVMDAALIKTVFREGSGTVSSQLAKGSTKEGISENIEETATALATQYLTTGKIDIGDAMTQGALGHLVGKTTAGSVGAVDVAAQTETINNNIATAVTSGDAASVNTAINNSVQQSLSSGASVEVAVGASVNSAITNGADAGSSITSAVTSAVTNGADVSQTVTSSIDSAITAGADTSVAINSTVTSAITSGADSSVVVNSAVTSAVTAGADMTSSVTTAVQAAVASGANVTTATNSATTAAVTASITSGSDVSTAVTNGVTAAVAAGADVSTAATTATSAAVTASITAGTSTSTAVTTAVDAAVTAGATVTSATNAAVTAAVTTAVTTGTNTATAITSSVNAAVTAGANVNTAVTTAVTAAVDSSITTAVNNGTSVATAITSSVTSSINAAVTSNTSVTTAVGTAVSTSITSAVTNNTNVATAVDSAVTSAVTTAITSNVNSTTAVSTAVNSAVSTAITNNVDANTAITTSVTSAVNAAVTGNVNVTTATNTAVTSAVDAAITSGVDVTTAITTAVNAAVKTNANVDLAELTKLATETATKTQETVTLRESVNDLISGTSTATTQTTPTSKTSSTAKKGAGLTAGLIGGAVMAGELDRLPPQMLKAYMTQDKFVDPLAKLQALQEGMNTEKMPETPQVKTQETDMPDQGTWKYGTAPDDIDSLFEEEAPAFKEGGFVAPLQMASGGAMALPLLAKSGGALGALPRPDGRMDFRHGAHVAGEGDGQSDDIKAMLADGEFVFPADVVSALGNGSTKAGSDKLYEMMHAIRARARSKKPKDLPPPALKSPLDYLKKKR